MMLMQMAVWLTVKTGPFRGKWRLLRWIAERPYELELLPPRIVEVDGGSHLLVEAFNNRAHYVEPQSLRKDAGVVQVFRSVLRDGDVVVDVGANIGRMTVLGSRLVGKTGKVFAFEPSPKVISSLYRNIAYNRCSNVTVFNSAVSDECGEITFFMPVGTNSAWGSIRNIGVSSSILVTVASTSLDSRSEITEPVRLLKIDVEGADLRVVRGARKLIQKNRPVVTLEFSPTWIRDLGDDPQWLRTFASEEGYFLYEVTQAGLRPLQELPEQQIDILCLPWRLNGGSWADLARSAGELA